MSALIAPAPELHVALPPKLGDHSTHALSSLLRCASILSCRSCFGPLGAPFLFVVPPLRGIMAAVCAAEQEWELEHRGGGLPREGHNGLRWLFHRAPPMCQQRYF
jgi:hypothetical protein